MPADRERAERPRIAYLITNSEIGGAQAHVATLLEALGNRVEALVLAGGDGPLLPTAEALGARAIRLSLLDNALSPLRAIAWRTARISSSRSKGLGKYSYVGERLVLGEKFSTWGKY